MAVGQHTVRVGKSIPMPTQWTRLQAGKSSPVQKWNSPQGGQIHYTDAATEHQKMTAVLFLFYFTVKV